MNLDALPGVMMPRRSTRFGPLLLVLAVAGGCESIALRRPVVEFTSREWTYGGVVGRELASRHYLLRTTSKDQAFIDSLPAFLEDCWDAYAAVLPPVENPETLLVCYLFQDRRQWEQFTDEFSPFRAATYRKIVSGGYTERGVTVQHYVRRANTRSLLAHEGLHQFLSVTRREPIPAWINEGLACYFEGYRLDERSQRPLFTPRENAQRANHLRQSLIAKRVIPLREILVTHAGEQVHKLSRNVRAYYAQEWSLVVYLMEPSLHNPYHKRFQALLADLGTDQMARRVRSYIAANTDQDLGLGEALFRAYLTEDLDAFQRDYEAFVVKLLNLHA